MPSTRSTPTGVPSTRFTRPRSDSVTDLQTQSRPRGQFDLFADLDAGADDGEAEALGDVSISVPDVEEWDKKTKLNFEREMLGLYVSDHPLSGMQSVLASLRDMSIAQLIDRAPTMPERSQVMVAGSSPTSTHASPRKATDGRS